MTRFRELDDVALELIRHEVDKATRESAARRHLAVRQEAVNRAAKSELELKEKVRDILTDRIDDILD